MLLEYITGDIWFRNGFIIGEWLILIIISWTFLNALSLWRKRPMLKRKIKLVGSKLLLGKWTSTLDFVTRGSQTILEAYKISNRRPFAIPALREYQVLVSEYQQVEELARSSGEVLSFHAAMNDRLSYKQIMFGFEHNDIDMNDTVPLYALKVFLRKNMPILRPKIQKGVVEGMEVCLRPQIPSCDGSICVSVFALAKAIAGRANNQILFGDELASTETFEQASLRYGRDGAFTMEVCRQLPGFVSPIVGRVLMAWSGAMNQVGHHVGNLVSRRLAASAEGRDEEFLDCTQFVIRASRTPRQRSHGRIVSQLVALLFASCYQLPMALAWAITMLSAHRECVDLLREEIQAAEENGLRLDLSFKSLRLLDSFLRESSRLNPLDGLSIQRKAVQSFTFSDGTHIPAGNLVAVPQQAIMLDPRNYEKPDRFNPFRFYLPDEQRDNVAATRYTDVNWTYPFWGSSRRSCPGRWYASDLLKIALIHLLKHYEFELLDPEKAKKPCIWTTALVPRADARIILRPREPEMK